MTELKSKDKHLDQEANAPKTLIKLDDIPSFYCFRCKSEKKSKLRVVWHTTEGKKIICNGCYGYLLSGAKK